MRLPWQHVFAQSLIFCYHHQKDKHCLDGKRTSEQRVNINQAIVDVIIVCTVSLQIQHKDTNYLFLFLRFRILESRSNRKIAIGVQYLIDSRYLGFRNNSNSAMQVQFGIANEEFHCAKVVKNVSFSRPMMLRTISTDSY